ncbi:rhamnogalacturonan acetylesterase [Marinimicrobium alkaliphilum]|uniref:rhamnogalacturonan acetylesterase n=1 Tax=Marinimicrobium alkaliphilum TaxID=2202654 RepID=UPI000DBA8247|nr:rhamnogalacturonan acetylesterase [Marinimicrobium alkaliphilum]
MTIRCLCLLFWILLAPASLAQPNLPRIVIAGDSTAASYNNPDQQGWAAVLEEYIDTDRAQVINRARGGRSSRTFITEGLWQTLLDDLRPGDIVVIQFGHNDASPVNDTTRARGSLPGTGDESQAIDNQLTGQPETVYTFGHYLRTMIADVRAQGATPLLLSPTQRNRWHSDGRLRRHNDHGRWAYEVALAQNTGFIDLTNLVADQLEALGQDAVAALYPKDHTHFNRAGALLHAEQVIRAARGLRPNPWDDLLNDRGRALDADITTWLRLPMRARADQRSVFLIGDSTVRNGAGDGANGEWGWGDFLARYLDTGRVNVVNRAVGGLSSRTYYTQGYWTRTLNMMQPGDVLVLQFGHNDAGAINDDSRARGTLRGIGPHYQQIDNRLTGEPETVYSYGGYLRRYVGEAKARGITVVICSPIPRNRWQGDALIRAEDSYPDWARQVALQSQSAFIDLHQQVAQRYDQLGPERVTELFANDHTHTSAAGAELNAELVAQALKPLLGL